MTFDHTQRFGIGMRAKAFPPFLLDRILTDCRDAVGSYPISGDEPVVKRTRQRKPTLASVARQAAKAGVQVARYDFRPDGTIIIVVGKPFGNAAIDMDDTTSPDRSEWD